MIRYLFKSLAVALTTAFVLQSATITQHVAGNDPPSSPVEWIKSRSEAVHDLIQKELEDLVKLYKHLHANPELSLQEFQTAARMAKELKRLGFEVTEGVGKTGVVGVLKNGKGPTVLVRTDMDALPVVEQTGLPYASKVRARDASGNEVGVMHACGHDIHMTCWTGTARVLAALKDQWSGTLVFIAQPAEEIGTGARLMLADGLYTRFPRPDYALALHADARLPVGQIAYSSGLMMANVDTVEVVMRGRGGHGAAPHTTIDPIVLSARFVLDLQTIVSRERNPLDPVVVTVGSIHGGTKANIIPNEVKMLITVRTTNDKTRKDTLDSIERIAKAAAIGAKAPEPLVRVDPGEFTPALYNDKELAERVTKVFRVVLGEPNVKQREPIMGGEDFSRYGRAGVPIFMYFIGTIDQKRFDAAMRDGVLQLPSMHSDQYYPTPEPSIRNGVLTMAMAVLELVGHPKR